MDNPVNADTVTELVVPSPFTGIDAISAYALDVLADTVGTSTVSPKRLIALSKIRPLVPKDVKPLVNALTALTRTYRKSLPKKKKPPVPRGCCKCCGNELPHRTFKARSYHSHMARLKSMSRKRWAKYPNPQDRSQQTSLARATILAARHDRWIAALRQYDPARTEHLLQTQGREAAIKLFKSLTSYRRRELLKRVPRPPKRKFPRESLVKAGLLPVKTVFRTKYFDRGKD